MISLITATIGRFEEFEILLSSLDKQTYKDFELIVVDQNDGNRIMQIIEQYPSLNIVYIKSQRKGLSLNRNIGLKRAKGTIIGFPDDDCYYDSSLLESVINMFNGDKGCKLVAVSAKDTESNRTFLSYSGQKLYRVQLYWKCISYNFFIKRQNDMRFDIRLGVGAEFGAGEETDFLWEYISKNDYGRFCSDVFVHHPHNQSYSDGKRVLNYGKGMGAMFKKEVFHRHHYEAFFIYLYMLTRSLIGLILKQEKSAFYNTIRGRVIGFYSY